jgi:hypothetical protein
METIQVGTIAVKNERLIVTRGGDLHWGNVNGRKLGSVIGGQVYDNHGNSVGRIGPNRAGFKNGVWYDRIGDVINCDDSFDVQAVFGDSQPRS